MVFLGTPGLAMDDWKRISRVISRLSEELFVRGILCPVACPRQPFAYCCLLRGPLGTAKGKATVKVMVLPARGNVNYLRWARHIWGICPTISPPARPGGGKKAWYSRRKRISTFFDRMMTRRVCFFCLSVSGRHGFFFWLRRHGADGVSWAARKALADKKARPYSLKPSRPPIWRFFCNYPARFSTVGPEGTSCCVEFRRRGPSTAKILALSGFGKKKKKIDRARFCVNGYGPPTESHCRTAAAGRPREQHRFLLFGGRSDCPDRAAHLEKTRVSTLAYREGTTGIARGRPRRRYQSGGGKGGRELLGHLFADTGPTRIVPAFAFPT